MYFIVIFLMLLGIAFRQGPAVDMINVGTIVISVAMVLAIITVIKQKN